MSSRGRGRNNRRSRPDNAAQHNVPQPGFPPPHDASRYFQQQTPSNPTTMLPFYTHLASLHQAMMRLHREMATVQEDISAVYCGMAINETRSQTENLLPQSHPRDVSYHPQPYTVDPTDNAFHSRPSDYPFVPQTLPIPHSLDPDHQEPGDVSRADGRRGNGGARNNRRRRRRHAGHFASQVAGERDSDRLGYISPGERVMEELSGSSSLGHDLRDGQSFSQHLETGFWDGVQHHFETQTSPLSQPSPIVIQELPQVHVTQPSPSSSDPSPPSVDPSPAVNNSSPEPKCSICKDEPDDASEPSLTRCTRCSFVSHQECLFHWFYESRDPTCPQRCGAEMEILLPYMAGPASGDEVSISDSEEDDSYDYEEYYSDYEEYYWGFMFEEPTKEPEVEVNESDDGIVEDLDHISRRGRRVWRKKGSNTAEWNAERDDEDEDDAEQEQEGDPGQDTTVPRSAWDREMLHEFDHGAELSDWDLYALD